MFYSQSLISKKGPLGTIWLAAYCCRKLTKDQIARTNIASSVDKIIPDVQISYRILAQLLLGVVRIFSKKVDFLYHDCNEALGIVNKTFAPHLSHVSRKATGAPRHKRIVTKEVELVTNSIAPANDEAVDAPRISSREESMLAPYENVTITIPEHFALDSFDLDVVEEGDGAGTNCLIPLEGEDRGDWQFLLKENDYHEETTHDLGFDSACFTPVRDVLSHDMFDVNLEINELYQASILETRKREIQNDLAPLEQHENNLRAKKSLAISIQASDFDKSHMMEVQQSMHSNLASVKTGNLEHTTPAMTPDKLRIPSASPSGAASPEFTVTTPARKETHRFSRKRKCFFDEEIVLSNETLRRGLNDSSRLVFKRRKAPDTYLDFWKVYKFSNLQKAFMEPLLPYKCLEIEDLSIENYSDTSTRNLSPEKAHKENHVQLEALNTSLDHEVMENEAAFCENTSIDMPASVTSIETRDGNQLDEDKFKESSAKEASDLEMNLMDRDISPLEGTSYQDGFSIRTRYAARHLCKLLTNRKENEQAEQLSLNNVLEGRKRSTCARFVYEMLVLKTHGCIEVAQELPYTDITISACPRLSKL